MKVVQPPYHRRATEVLLAAAALVAFAAGSPPELESNVGERRSLTEVSRTQKDDSEYSPHCTEAELESLFTHFTHAGCWPPDWDEDEVNWRRVGKTEDRFFCDCFESYLDTYGYFPMGCDVPELHNGLKAISGRTAYQSFEHMRCPDYELNYDVPQLTNVTISLLDAGEVTIINSLITVELDYWSMLQADPDHQLPGTCTEGGLGYQIRTRWNNDNTDFLFGPACDTNTTGEVYWSTDYRGRKILMGDLSEKWGPLRLSSNWIIDSLVRDEELLQKMSASIYHGINNISDYSIVFMCTDGLPAFCAGFYPELEPSTDPRKLLPGMPHTAIVSDKTPFIVKAMPMVVGVGGAAALVAFAGIFCYWKRRKQEGLTWSFVHDRLEESNATAFTGPDSEDEEPVPSVSVLPSQIRAFQGSPVGGASIRPDSMGNRSRECILSDGAGTANYSTFATAGVNTIRNYSARETLLSSRVSRDSCATSLEIGPRSKVGSPITSVSTPTGMIHRMNQVFQDTTSSEASPSARVKRASEESDPVDFSVADELKLKTMMQGADGLTATTYRCKSKEIGRTSAPGPPPDLQKLSKEEERGSCSDRGLDV